MASCSININGTRHGASTAVYDYVDANQERNAKDLIESLQEEVDIEYTYTDSGVQGRADTLSLAEKLEQVNKVGVNLYQASGALFNIQGIKKDGYVGEEHVNLDVLNELSYMPASLEESEGDTSIYTKSSYQEKEVEPPKPKSKKDKRKEKARKIAKVFGVKERDITLVEAMIVDLQKEINRLSVQEETENIATDIAILENLKKQLQNAEATKEIAEAFADFVYYIESSARQAKQELRSIRDNYAENFEDLTDSEKLALTSQIFELKQRIDAFYSHESEDNSLVSIMQLYMDEFGDAIDMDTRISLVDAIQDMSAVNKRYADIGLPILADYLMRVVPDEKINSQLRDRINDIKKNRRINGLRRKDKRYLELYTKYPPLSPAFRQAVLDLNIQQLEEQIVGRDSIIRELREAHRDPGFISTYMDPLVYSSEVAMQAFALTVKSKLYEAHETTIDTKYAMRESYERFINWKGIGEDNPAQTYDDILEEVTLYIYDSEQNKYIPKRVLSFVQKYDITAFEGAKNLAFSAFREKYDYPVGGTTEELIDYFNNNPKADEYQDAVAAWYEDNTVAIKGAKDTIKDLKERINKVTKRKIKLESLAKKTNKQLVELDRLTYELPTLRNELKQISRNGVPIGRLTVPNLKKYENSKFTNMPAEAKEYYDILLEIYKQDQKKLGRNSLPKNPWEKFSYIVPSIRKSTYDTLKEQGFKASAEEMFNDAFLFQETDTEFGVMLDANGEKMKSIPRYYTNLVDANLVSKDITASIIKFHDMSNRFKSKAEISGVVNIMRTAVANRDRIELNAKGEPVIDSVAKRLGINKIAKQGSQDSNALKQLDSFIDNVYFGIADKEETKYSIAAKLSRTKFAQFGSTVTALSTLAGNYLQGVNQLIIDSVQGAQEGWAAQFYNNKNLWWAKEQVYNVFNGNLVTGGAERLQNKFIKTNKLNQFLEMFDAFQSFGQDVGRQTGSTAKKAWRIDSLFMIQHSAEYMTTAERALALADTYRGKLKDKAGNVIKNEKGEDANLWDVLTQDEKGKLIVDPNVANFNKAEYQIKLHGILKRTNQIKGEFDKPLANRYAVGKMLVLFRSYFMPGWRKRFGHAAGGTHIDVEMGQITEGYYQTFANNLANALYDFRNLEFAAGIKNLFNVGEDELSKANRARLFYELIAINLATMIATVIGMMDDDDEEGYLSSMITYQMFRLRTELTSFRSAQEFFRIAQSPTAVATPIKNLADLVTSTYNLGKYSVGIPVDEKEVFYQRRSGRYEKGDLKITKELLDVLPVVGGFLKSASPEEAVKFYE